VRKMMKKLAAMAGAAALLLGAVAPTFAEDGPFFPWWSQDVAVVNNGATAVANTGGNKQGNGAAYNIVNSGNVAVTGNNWMGTGKADAYAGALVIANTHMGCDLCSVSLFHQDYAGVNNGATAVADSGNNGQGSGANGNYVWVGGVYVTGNNGMDTGNAISTARSWTVVNTHWE
jgi:hypothetical protein